jgi:hypothetical protein
MQQARHCRKCCHQMAEEQEAGRVWCKVQQNDSAGAKGRSESTPNLQQLIHAFLNIDTRTFSSLADAGSCLAASFRSRASSAAACSSRTPAALMSACAAVCARTSHASQHLHAACFRQHRLSRRCATDLLLQALGAVHAAGGMLNCNSLTRNWTGSSSKASANASPGSMTQLTEDAVGLTPYNP